MVTRDILGNFIEEGNAVTFALTTGNFVIGRIDKITSGLDGGPPVAFVTVTIPLPIQNGLIPGITLIHAVEEEKKVEI